MAETQPNPLRLDGYDDEFEDKIEDDLVCPICILPLRKRFKQGDVVIDSAGLASILISQGNEGI